MRCARRTPLDVTMPCAAWLGALGISGVGSIVGLVGFAIVCLVLGIVYCLLRENVVEAGSTDASSPQTIASFTNEVDAAVVVGALEDAGIHAMAVGGYTSGFRAEAPGEVRVVVALGDVGRARDVMREMRLGREGPEGTQAEADTP
ncbi:MAG: DUF2007 domain-containing protein [Thermoguttaceae bacterium]|jgi:hypothetical protein|nr:DUF2007 domain-containing protein [Thermoguttaceae bacterium]